MIPALIILKTKGAALGVTQPWQFFWATGSLSAFLDNAPTYLTFTSLGQGVLGDSSKGLELFSQADVSAYYLSAISIGAVFMGALSYIGNGPNFMVKAIAEEAKVKMPSFFGYMGWSLLFLGPILIVVTFLFCSKTFTPEQRAMPESPAPTPTAPAEPGH
jgi:Na+/H+ antiporter NhaD/arsenite permease-like protein